MLILMQIKKIFTAAILAFVVFACSESVPKGVMPRDKMVDVLYDFHLAQSLEQPHLGPKIDIDAVMSAFYEKHNITKEDLDSSLSWYSKNMDLLADIYKELGQRYEAAEKQVGSPVRESSSYNVSGDTLDIWNQSRLRFLTKSKFNNHFDFSIPADTTFYIHDLFQLMFDLHFMDTPQNSQTPTSVESGVAVGLVVHYDNDSISSTMRTIYSPMHSSLILKADSALKIKSVSGFFSLPSKRASSVIIDGISLLRFHTESEEPAKIEEPEERDSIIKSPTDSLPAQRRLSPQEIRSSKPVEHKVRIRKR